jgi:thermitase
MHMEGWLSALRAFLSSRAGLAVAALGVLLVAFGTLYAVKLLTAPPEAGVLPLPPSDFVPGEFLVKFHPGAPAEDIRNFHAEQNAPEIELIPGIDVSRRRVPEGATVREMVERYRRNPNVQYAEPNFRAGELDTPNDPLFGSRQWNLQKMGAPAAWELTKGSPSVVIAIADSGVLASHEDLSGKLVPGSSFMDGVVDTLDQHGHGTIVSGLAASRTNNGSGIAGLGRDSSLMPLKIAGADGFSTYSAIAAATVYAADHGAKVLNISYGGGSDSETLREAMTYGWSQGLVITAAAGNSGTLGIAYPAAYPNVLAVGSTDGSDLKSNFSSFGPELKVVAPGSGVYSTNMAGGYGAYFGTSYAAPEVAGLAALLFAANPSLTNQQVVNHITSTAVDLGPTGRDDQFGFGRINAAAAVQQALSGGVPAAPAPTSTSAAAATATTVPATATRIPATSTAVAPTATTPPLVATATRVPPTATRPPATATSAPAAAATSAPAATASGPATRTESFTGRVEQRGTTTANHQFNVAAAGNITASLDWNGSADLNLVLLGPGGQQLASGSGRPETLTFTATQTGSYTLRVTAASGQANYTLSATHP